MNGSSESLKNGGRTEKLLNEKPGRLILSMGIPSMFQMLSGAVGALAGSFFIAADGIGALSAAFPVQALLTAFAIAVGIGSGSALSRAIGRGDTDGARRTASAGTVMALAIGLPLAGVGAAAAFFVPGAFDLSDADVDSAKIYLLIVSAVFPVTAVHTVYNRLAVSEGVTVPPMLAAISGAAVTICVDLILFSVENGLPPTARLAAADVAGQTVTLTGALIIAKRLPVKPFLSKSVLPDKKVYAEILKVALPSAIQNGVDALFTTILNFILGGGAIAFYGTFYKVRQQALTPVYGLNQGTVPILGAAFGGGKRSRFKKVFLIASAIALGVAVSVAVAAEFAAEPLLRLFEAEDGKTAFKIMVTGFVPSAAALMLSAAFVATGHGGKALALNLTRGAGIGIPAAILLRALPINYTWFALTAAEFLALAVFVPIAVVSYKKSPFGTGKG